MENENEGKVVEETTEEVETEDVTTEDEVTEEEDEESVDDLKKQVADLTKANATLAKQKDHWRTKANSKGEQPTESEQKSDDLSSTDLYTLVSAGVHQEDVQEVVKSAKLLGVGIADALKDDTVKAILEKRDSQRKAAQAANVKTSRKSAHQPTDSEIIAEANKGNIPDKGSPDAEQLFWARRGGRPDKR